MDLGRGRGQGRGRQGPEAQPTPRPEDVLLLWSRNALRTVLPETSFCVCGATRTIAKNPVFILETKGKRKKTGGGGGGKWSACKLEKKVMHDQKEFQFTAPNFRLHPSGPRV